MALIASECYFFIHSCKKMSVSHGDNDSHSLLSTLFFYLISQDELSQCISALNGHLVSVGPAGSGSEDRGYAESIL